MKKIKIIAVCLATVMLIAACFTGCSLSNKQLDELLAKIPNNGEVNLLYGNDDTTLDKEVALKELTKEVRNEIQNNNNVKITVANKTDIQYTVTLSSGINKVSKDVTRTPHRKDTFTVATYNIYGCHNHKRAHPNEDAISMDEYSQKMDNCDVDIVGLQEFYYNNDDSNSQMKQLSDIGTYPYTYGHAGFPSDGQSIAGAVIASKYPMVKTDGGVYKDNSTNENRGWSRAEFVIEGKKVAVYDTHIMYAAGDTWHDPNNPGNRNEMYATDKPAEIKELIDTVRADKTPYKIITGDFNTDQSKDETEIMRQYFNDSNGWKNQWNYTCYMDSSMLTPWVDHVLVTTNIEIVDVNVVSGVPSDHNLTCAKLRLKDDTTCLQSTQLLDNMIAQAKECIGDGIDAKGYTTQQQTTLQKEIAVAEQISAEIANIEASDDAANQVKAESDKLKSLIATTKHQNNNANTHTIIPYLGQAYCEADSFGHTGFRTFYYCKECNKYFYYNENGTEQILPTNKMSDCDDDSEHFPERYLTIPAAPHILKHIESNNKTSKEWHCDRCNKNFDKQDTNLQ